MQNIRTIRKEVLRLSQSELAIALGVQQCTISRYERGALKVDARTRLALEALVARTSDKEAPAVAS